MAVLNVSARFLLELAGIAAVAWWGYQAAEPLGVRLGLAVGAPLLLVVAWALLVAPNAANPIGADARVLLGSALLLLAAGLLGLADRPVLAAALSVAVVVNTVLLFALGDGGLGVTAASAPRRAA